MYFFNIVKIVIFTSDLTEIVIQKDFIILNEDINNPIKKERLIGTF